jgi:putative phosphonate metabolism protein
MAEWRRYAVYAAPGGALAEAAHGWLGWDAYTGQPRPHPDVGSLPRPLADLTEAPRKYGFHATLKAPFRLAPGADGAALDWAVAALAARLAPAEAPGLRLAEVEGFLALIPEGDGAALSALAARAVEGLDVFRAPLTPDEVARRRPDRLSARQRVLLDRWGYPYVMEEFAFHLTLTGSLRPGEAAPVMAALRGYLPLLPQPFTVDALALFGEAEDGRFHLLSRHPLTG